MSFKKKEAETLLALCKRCCCICHTFCGIHIEMHHIVAKSEGSNDEIENAIPLCFNCHSEVHLDGKYPKGRKYSNEELRKHKAMWIESSNDLDIHEVEKIKNEILTYLDSFKISEIYDTVQGMSVQLGDLINLKKIVAKQLDIQNKTSVKIIDDPDYYFKLGNIELEYGNYTEARNYFNSAVERGMKKASLHFNLFKTETNLGNYSEAFDQYKSAIENDSNLALVPSRYRILMILGEGGTSIAYKGFDIKNQQTVLIKVFKGNITKDYKKLHQIEKNSRILKSLDSEHIIKCIEEGIYADRKFTVYEFIEGQTLKDAIKNNSLTKKEKEQIIIKLSETVLFLHNNSLLHLDIKPSNILLREPSNLPVLFDFGSVLHAENTTQTSIGFTWAYAAPELMTFYNVPSSKSSLIHANGDSNLSYPLDIYSLGVTIAELLTGAHPKMKFSFPKIREEYSPELEKIVINMTSPEPNERPNMGSILSQFNVLFNNNN